MKVSSLDLLVNVACKIYTWNKFHDIIQEESKEMSHMTNLTSKMMPSNQYQAF